MPSSQVQDKASCRARKAFPSGLVGVLWQPGELEVLFTMAGNTLPVLLGCIFPIAGAWGTLETLLLPATCSCCCSHPQFSVDLGQGKGEGAFRQSGRSLDGPQVSNFGQAQKSPKYQPYISARHVARTVTRPSAFATCYFYLPLVPLSPGAAEDTCPDVGASVRPAGSQLGGLRRAAGAWQVP